MDIPSIPRYAIKRQIGAGGMATVYLAFDQKLHREVALKMIHPHLLSRVEAVRRFDNEARAIAALSHQNIVRLYDYGTHGEQRFLVMEYVDGVTLASVIERGPLPNLALLEVASQLFAGLAAAHANGIYHRDIKPSNIMIDKSGCVKLMDFGIAYIVNEESLTVTGSFLGSPNYISPEQGEGKPVSDRSDVFSTGSVLYECATGQTAFAGDNPHAIIYTIVHETCRHVWELNPLVLGGTAALIDACLIKSPTERLDVSRCLAMIDGICGELGVKLDKNRLVSLLTEREKYESSEKRELFERFVERGRREFRQRRWAAALRSLSNAEQFGALERKDKILITKIAYRAVARRALSTAAAVMLIAAVVVTSLRHLSHLWRGNSKTSDSIRLTAASDSTPAPPATPSEPHGSRTQGTKVQEQRERVKKTAASPPTTTDTLNPAIPNGPAYLRVLSNPPYALVMIDGISIGSTPFEFPFSVRAGVHRVSFRKDGYVDLDTTIVLRPHDSGSLEIRLQKVATSDSGGDF